MLINNNFEEKKFDSYSFSTTEQLEISSKVDIDTFVLNRARINALNEKPLLLPKEYLPPITHQQIKELIRLVIFTDSSSSNNNFSFRLNKAKTKVWAQYLNCYTENVSDLPDIEDIACIVDLRKIVREEISHALKVSLPVTVGAATSVALYSNFSDSWHIPAIFFALSNGMAIYNFPLARQKILDNKSLFKPDLEIVCLSKILQEINNTYFRQELWVSSKSSDVLKRKKLSTMEHKVYDGEIPIGKKELYLTKLEILSELARLVSQGKKPIITDKSVKDKGEKTILLDYFNFEENGNSTIEKNVLASIVYEKANFSSSQYSFSP